MNIRHLAALLALFFMTDGFACDCSTRGLPIRLKSSHSVFIGEVVPSSASDFVLFRVIERFKGEPGQRAAITTLHSDCDYFPLSSLAKPGTRYLVFVSRYQGKNITDQCSGTAPLERAAEDIKAMRALKQNPAHRAQRFRHSQPPPVA